MDDKSITTLSKAGKKLVDNQGKYSQRARDSSCLQALANIEKYCDSANIFRDYTDRLKVELFEDISETLDLTPAQKDKMKKERKRIMKDYRGKQRLADMKEMIEDQENQRITRSRSKARRVADTPLSTPLTRAPRRSTRTRKARL